MNKLTIFILNILIVLGLFVIFGNNSPTYAQCAQDCQGGYDPSGSQCPADFFKCSLIPISGNCGVIPGGGCNCLVPLNCSPVCANSACGNAANDVDYIQVPRAPSCCGIVPSTPTPTPAPTVPPGWGGCGSCSNCDENPPGSGSHPASECVTTPTGVCTWDPTTCGPGVGGGATPTPVPRNPICGEPCTSADTCTPATHPSVGAVSCINGTCQSVACYLTGGNTIYGTLCLCDFPGGHACGENCSGAIGLCDSTTTCTYPAQSKCDGAGPGICIPPEDQLLNTSYNGQPFERPFCGPTTADPLNHFIYHPDPVFLDHVFTTDEVKLYICSLGWWQSVRGDIITQEDVFSNLPSTRKLIEDISGTSPGLVVYNTGIEIGAGVISISQQHAVTNFDFDKYNFAYFQGLMGPDSLAAANANTVNSILDPGAQTAGGYVWINTGDWDTTADITIPSGRKVVVFVQGTAHINNNITITDSSNSYFMLLTTGGIQINPTVSTMEGVFYTDGAFDMPSSGAADPPFVLRGSVFATLFDFNRFISPPLRNFVATQRFRFDPALVANYPADISPKKVVWQEVLP